MKRLDMFGARLLAESARRQKGQTWQPPADTGRLRATLSCGVRLVVIASASMWIGSFLAFTREEAAKIADLIGNPQLKLYYQKFGPRRGT